MGRARGKGEAPRLLVVDDDEGLTSLLDAFLEDEGYEVWATTGGKEAIELASRHTFVLAVVGLELTDGDGIEVICQLAKVSPGIQVIGITADERSERMMAATAAGASEIFGKPLEMASLADAVAGALFLRPPGAVADVGATEQVQAAATIIGKSPIMKETFKWAGRIARTDDTVLVLGETGTGKELMAKLLHYYSRRAGGPFVAVNCGALPDELIEAELFGHEKGAFTSAVEQKRGRFEQAHGGSLFLDEIGELPPRAQTKLLRVLEERCVDRVGGNQPIPVDVRVIAATNADLERLIERKDFRTDLWYRLNVMPLMLPPLRERIEDIPELARFFLRRYAEQPVNRVTVLESDALNLLQAYPWPGNVRELRNILHRAAVSAESSRITARHIERCLPPPAKRTLSEPTGWQEYVHTILHASRHGGVKKPYTHLMEEAQRQVCQAALFHAAGNKSAAARLLGMSRQYFTEKVRSFGL